MHIRLWKNESLAVLNKLQASGTVAVMTKSYQPCQHAVATEHLAAAHAKHNVSSRVLVAVCASIHMHNSDWLSHSTVVADYTLL